MNNSHSSNMGKVLKIAKMTISLEPTWINNNSLYLKFTVLDYSGQVCETIKYINPTEIADNLSILEYSFDSMKYQMMSYFKEQKEKSQYE